MSFRRWTSYWIGVGVLLLLVLYVLIPALSSRLRTFYNQDVYADGYDEIAMNLALGNGYRFYPDTAETMMREPGYPLVLAGLFRTAGTDFSMVKALNLSLALGAAALVVLIARRLGGGPVVQVLAPSLFLFHPAVLVAQSRGGPEMLFTLGLSAFVLLFLKAREAGGLRAYLLAGAVLGITVLVKSTPMLLPVALAGLLVGGHPVRRTRSAAGLAVMAVAMAAFMMPWVIRNYRLTGKVVPAASVLGISAHAGWYINSHLSLDRQWAAVDRQAAAERKALAIVWGYEFKDVKDAYYQMFYDSGDELRFSSKLLGLVVSGYRREPAKFVRTVAANSLNLWIAGKTWRSTAMNALIQAPFLILAGLGAAGLWRAGNPHIAPVLLILAYMIAVCLPILAQARYSIPLLPLVAILAAFGLAGLRARWLERKAEP